MFDRFERALKIICLGLGILLIWQWGGLILRGDPLTHLKIPALPALPAARNEPAKSPPKETNAITATHLSAKSTNALAADETNASAGRKHRKAGPPGMLAQMMGGGMARGKKMELSPEDQARMDKIIDSEILGVAMRPMPVALIGIADEEAFIRATSGQVGPVKVGDELGGIKLLRIGINRVLVEQDGEKKELTLFGGLGGESLLPKESGTPSIDMRSTNMPAINGPGRVATNNAITNRILWSKQKKTP